MTHQEIIEAKARHFAKVTHWNADDAVTFITELLTEVNMHTVCQGFLKLLAEEEVRQHAAEVAFHKAMADYEGESVQ